MSKNPMNILIVTMLFPNSKEPTKAPFNLEIAKALSKVAQLYVVAPVRILPGRGVKDVPVKEFIEGIPVFHPRIFLPPKICIFLHGWIYYLVIKTWLRKVIREFDFDIILSPYLFPDGFAGALLGKSFARPVVLEALGCDVNLLTKLVVRSKLIKKACLLSERVISVNQDMKRTLVSLGVPEGRIQVIYNGVDKSKFQVLDKDSCRYQLKLPAEKRIFLFVGSLEIVKGVYTLLKAWKLFVVTAGKENLLVIVGNGREQVGMEEFIRQKGLSDSIFMAGARSHAEIPVWMNASDIFCLPSIREGYPNVLVEALSCGKFVVASAVGGIPEIIVSPAQGALVAPNQPEALKEAFEKSLRMVTDGTTAVSSVMSWEESALQRYRLFQDILQKRK